MYKLTSLIALSTLALTGCLEQDPTATTVAMPPQQVSPLVSPFTPVSNPPAGQPNDAPVAQPPVSQPPVAQLPVAVPPVVQPPIAQSPVSGPDSGNVNINAIVNGPSERLASSVWTCTESAPGSVDGEVSLFVFFGDGNGYVGDEEESLPITWISTGAYIEIYANDQYLAQFDNVAVNASAGTLAFTYISFDGESGSLRCTLGDTDSSGGGTGSQPPVDMNAPTGGGVSRPAPTVPTSQDSLINTFVGEDLQNAWVCELADGSPAVLFFIDQGVGGIVNSTYLDGITMRWSSSAQGVTMDLEDGNTVTLSSLMFSGGDFFQVDNVNYQGSDIPGMSCELSDL